MNMESLGGSMPAGQPIALAAGNRTHVFAIAAGGVMNHWTSADGGPWTGPTPLPGGNLEPSFPCAITLADGSLHVFAIVHGGSLCHWRSTDGSTWTSQLDGRAAVPGVGNGVAAASWGGSRVDAFATTPAGIVQYSFDGTTTLPPGPMLPASGGLNRCVLAAASTASNTVDVFAVDPNVGMPLRWHFDGATWNRSMLPGPALHIANNNNNQNLNSFAAARDPGSPTIDLFAITADMRVTHWSVNGGASTFEQLPASPWPLAEGVVSAVPTPIGLDVFAIGSGDVFHGGPLVRWHFDGSWHAPVAYESGLAAGGVGAAFGAGGLEAFGIQSGTSNPLLHWPAGIAAAQHDGWVNWAGTQRIDHPEGHCYPTSLEELVEIVKTAAQQGKRVRAVGSSWSFSDIAVTPEYIVETNRMNQVLTNVIPKAQSPNAVSILQRRRKPGQPPPPPVPFHLVHVEAGVKLEDLMSILDGMGMGPGTMGGSAGQTVAGVVSTSVHGSHYKLPPVPDWVRAIHFVGPDGRQYWIEPQNRPVTDPTKLAAALGPMVTIKYDNDWFDSVLVSVGSLGIVYSLILEVRDAYKLEATRTRTTWSALRPQLSVGNAGNLFQAPDGVQLAIDPGTLASPDPVCILETRRTVPMTTPSSGAAGFDALAAFCEGDGLLDLLFQSAAAAGITGPVLASLMPAVLAMEAALAPAIVPLIAPLLPVLAAATTVAAATPALLAIIRVAGPGALGDVIGHVLDGHPELIAPVTSGLTQMMQPTGVTVNIAHNIMAPKNKGECAARGLALEIAIDTAGDAHLAFADAAIALLMSEATKGNYLGGWFSLRFVGSSRAILSPEHSAMTCTAEFVGLRTLSDTRALLDRLEALARDKGATQHWAMCNDLRASDVARGYPRLDTWRRVRWELTSGGRVRTFNNDFTSRAGLAEPPANQSWGSLGGLFTSGPGVTSRARNVLDVFGRGTDNALWGNSWNGEAWGNWFQVSPARIASDPAAVSRGPNLIDVFARGEDNQIWLNSFNNGTWSGWTVTLGGVATSGPAVASWAPNRMDVFVRGTDNALWQNTWNGAAWAGWNQVSPAPIASDPAAVSRAPNLIDVFARGQDNQVWQNSFDGSQWSGWNVSLGGVVTSGPTVASTGPDQLDVFARGTDNALWRTSWAGQGWSGWSQVSPAPIGSGPAAVSWGPNRIDVFAEGTDTQMYTLSLA
jgi:hypothetical protein